MSFINLNPVGPSPSAAGSNINAGHHHHHRRSSIGTPSDNNVITGEWTAKTDTDNVADPFGEQQHPSLNSSDTETDSQTQHTRTIIRKIGLKRNKETVSLDSRVKLERVLGLTVSSNVSLDCDSHTGTVVYPSGCVLVLYNQRRNKQIHIINSPKKPITACKFSKDGKYIVTGECGHQPQVRVWDVATGEQLASLAGHKYDINCVAFSPSSKYVVSVGSQHDMLVNVWDWKNNIVVASNKVSVKVNSVSFSDDGDYFVTVGNRHVKFWYLDYNDMANKNKFESLPLMGRNAILGDQRNNYFCDVACGRAESKESTYAITKSGLLCEFNNRRLLDKWVELKTESANCITLSRHFICVGCAQGVIRCFKPQTLEFVCTLPRPHSLGLDIAKGFTARNDSGALTNKLNSANNKPKYADTIAVSYDEINKIVTTIYSDRSIYFWTLGDIKRIGKLNSFLYHSQCIWDIEVYPVYTKSAKPLLPPGTFLTCSGDDTIRIWNTEYEQNSQGVTAKNSPYIYKKNIFSSELLKILYMDPDMTYLCDQDLVQSRNGNSSSGANGNGANAKDDTSYDSKNGIRAIKFSNDGRHLASGDRCGNIRIFDLEFQKDLFKIEAHDGEVLCLEYSNEEFCGRALLVSASRDRMIHVYDVHRQYSCIQNIDDHSSSITSVKFVCDKLNPSILQMVSCGADKSLIFRKQFDADQDFRLEHHVAGKSTYYDMAVDEKKNHILTVSQDRLIRVYDTKTGKNTTSFKGSMGDDGALIKTAFDPSATFIATSCTDKCIYIFDYQSGECLATTSGHSEIVTGLKFSQDGRHLISISGDGCIFQWRLPVEMTNAIASKLGLPLISDSSHTTTITNKSLHLPLTNSASNEPAYRNGTNSPQTNSYRFSIGSLPSWAKKQMFEELSRDHPVKPSDYLNETDKSASSKTLPRGRWAQRVIEEGQSDIILNQGLVKTYASTFETLASRSTPSTPSGTNSPTLKELKMNRLNTLGTPTRIERTKSSMSSGVEDDDEDRNTTDSENTYSHDSSYKVTKVDVRSKGSRHYNNKHSGSNYGMISSISMANINDLPFDEEDTSNHKNKDDSDNRFNSLYMSTENLERIDQRNRYLKNVFENIDKGNFENNASSASDDSGINQIDHSLSSTSGMAPGAGLLNGCLPPLHPNSRQSLSSKFNNKTQSPTNKYDGATSDDATTLSDNTDIQLEQSDTVIPVEIPKFSILDTIKETPAKEDTLGHDSLAKSMTDLTNSSINVHNAITSVAVPFVSASDCSSSVSSSSTLVAVPKSPYSSETTTSSSSGNIQPANNIGDTSNQPSVSKKREELRKTLTDAKKKLESLGWKESSLTNSKSVANLRDQSPDEEKDEKNYNSLSADAYRLSISLSDLSMSPGSQTLPKRLSVYRSNINNNNTNSLNRSGNMNHYQFAPLWDSRRPGAMPAANSGSLSRSPSTNALNKVDMMRSQSTLCRQPGLWSAANNGVPPMVPHQQAPNGAIIKQQNGHLNVPNSGSSSLMINPRSGRSSAPPSQFRKANSAATVSCASSSRRGDSTEDDEELESTINSDDDNSDEHRNLRPRPVTPPKPNILKQIRRGSNASNQAQAAHYTNGHYAQHHPPPPSSQSAAHPTARQRRLWSTDTMRSSKSEFNLASIGRETPVRRRNNSGITTGAWPPNSAMAVHNDRLDLYSTNPSSIPLSLDLCQHLINEMNFLTTYAARIHERASYSTNQSIVDYLNETMGQVSRDIQNLINRPPATNPGSATATPTNTSATTTNPPTTTNKNPNAQHSIAADTQEMFQKFLTFLQFQQMNGNNNNSNNNNNSTTPSSTSTQPSFTNGSNQNNSNNSRSPNNPNNGNNLNSQNNDHYSS